VARDGVAVRVDADHAILAEAVARIGQELDALELRALFTSEHAERDAICEVHSGAGGTDAQDWTQMLLRRGELDGTRLLAPATLDLMAGDGALSRNRDRSQQLRHEPSRSRL